MDFTLWGFEVYTSEVDDRGIDFVVRTNDRIYYDIQVKSVRRKGYIFFNKSTFQLRSNLLASILIFNPGEPPAHYLIPSTEWLVPNKLLVDRNYEGLKSTPEWGINISGKNMPIMETYAFDTRVRDLLEFT